MKGNGKRGRTCLLVPRLGREFNITPEFGIALEAGLMLMLIDKNTAKKERTGAVSGDLDLIGSGFIYYPLPALNFSTGFFNARRNSQ